MQSRSPYQTDLRAPRGNRSQPGSRGPRRKARLGKGLVVVFGAIILTSAAIYASDGMRMPGSSLFGALGTQKIDSRCPEGMILVNAPGGGFCVDMYENSPGRACAHSDPTTPQEKSENLRNPACAPISSPERTPWTNITLGEAQQLCARAGKRLPTGEEWYRAALGTPDDVGEVDGCVLGRTGQTVGDKTGVHQRCVSGAGAFDMVGNVWEWVEEMIVDGKHNDQDVPSEGYISGADIVGFPIATSGDVDPAFNGDYLWIEKTGTRVAFRGGYWGTDEKAGLYTWNITQPPSFIGVGIGFRCVR